MAQALFISNNQVLNDIYEVNLEAYLGTNVTIHEKLEDALLLLELNPKFDVIICLCLMEGVDVALAIHEHIQKEKLDIPLVVLGKQSDLKEEEQVFVLPASYNVKSVIKTTAKALEITPREMANKAVSDYYPIPIKLFSHFGTLNCDVFLKVKKSSGNEYIKVFNKGFNITNEIQKYRNEEIQNLYVDSMERLHFVNQISGLILDGLESDEVPIERKMEIVEQGIELVADQLFENPEVTEEMAKISSACIKSVTNVMKDNPRLGGLLQSLLDNKSGYVYTHGIITTFVATHIVKNISWGGESHIDKLSFVLFFHDIFLVPIYNRYPDARIEEDLIFNDELAEKEKELVLNHAKLAGETVQKFPRAPLGADAIITQHHGVTNGEGFAVKYKDDISPLAKVIIISECFAEEVMRKLDQTSIEPFNKEAMIDFLNRKFARQSYHKIIDTLSTIDI